MPIIDIEKIYEWEKQEAIDTLKECGLDSGMTVIDFGCGLGHYTIPASIISEEQGKIYAIDSNKWIISEIEKRVSEYNIKNIFAVKADERSLSQYENSVNFIMYYDMFHALKEKNKFIIDGFYSALSENGILSFAVFNEIELIQDPINGPKTPKGKPAWFRIPYEEALEHYKVIETIESSGFKLKSIVKEKCIHFDDYWKKKSNVSFSSLERKDIYNFVKI